MVELSGEKAYVKGLGVLRLLHKGSRGRGRGRGHGKAVDLENLECKTKTIID